MMIKPKNETNKQTSYPSAIEYFNEYKKVPLQGNGDMSSVGNKNSMEADEGPYHVHL